MKMIQSSLILLSFQSLCFRQCADTKSCFSNDSHIGLCLETFDSGKVQAEVFFLFFFFFSRQRIRRIDQMDCTVTLAWRVILFMEHNVNKNKILARKGRQLV